MSSRGIARHGVGSGRGGVVRVRKDTCGELLEGKGSDAQAFAAVLACCVAVHADELV